MEGSAVLTKLRDLVSRKLTPQVIQGRLEALADQLERVEARINGQLYQKIRELVRFLELESQGHRNSVEVLLDTTRKIEDLVCSLVPKNENFLDRDAFEKRDSLIASPDASLNTILPEYIEWLLIEEARVVGETYRIDEHFCICLAATGLTPSPFISTLVRKVLFENPNDQSGLVEPSDLRRATLFFFGPIYYFRRMKKINGVLLSRSVPMRMEYFRKSIELVCTSAPSVQGSDGLRDSRFPITSSGILNSPRGCSDSLTIIGKPEFPEFILHDIPLLESDPKAESVQAILYWDKQVPYVIDCSELTPVGFRLNLETGPYKLQPGQLFDIGNGCIFKVVNIKMFEGQTVHTTAPYEDEDEAPPPPPSGLGDSELVITFLTGAMQTVTERMCTSIPQDVRYQERAARHEQRKQTVQAFLDSRPNKHCHLLTGFFAAQSQLPFCEQTLYNFIVGRGGGGVQPSVFISSSTGVSADHASIIYYNYAWYFIDMDSTNGTFALLKTVTEYENREPSQPYPLSSVLKFGGYSFFKIDHNDE